MQWPRSRRPYFNSRPREGANLGNTGELHVWRKFQFPPPRGGEQASCAGMVPRYNFNSRPREGANLGTKSDSACPKVFQFPPPRGGERRVDTTSYLGVGISIPAPARGRTVVQHALCRVDTFQFPPPRGGEPAGMPETVIKIISIPAPARGRTHHL